MAQNSTHKQRALPLLTAGTQLAPDPSSVLGAVHQAFQTHCLQLHCSCRAPTARLPGRAPAPLERTPVARCDHAGECVTTESCDIIISGTMMLLLPGKHRPCLHLVVMFRCRSDYSNAGPDLGAHPSCVCADMHANKFHGAAAGPAGRRHCGQAADGHRLWPRRQHRH
jgi:hypothetical protein